MDENYSIEMIYKDNNVTHDDLIGSLNGTSPSEVFLMTFVVPASSLCWTVMPGISVQFLGHYGRNVSKAVFLNFIFLFTLTVWSNYVAAILWSLLGFLVTVAFIILNSGKYFPMLKKNLSFYQEKNEAESSKQQHLHKRVTVWEMPVKNSGHHIAFVADYRGHVLLCTAISILAVDFPVFPRSFAKTENYGWSIMDAGVGCFVAVHGICSPYARKLTDRNLHCIWKSVKSSLPLLGLGFLRLIAVKAVNYHENVSEYGMHWNFFFTLAITKILCSTVLLVFHAKVRSGILAVIFASLHQCLLSVMGVSEFVLSESRENFLQANKEGISSILGFVAIYFTGVEIGSFLLKPRCKLQEWVHVLGTLVAVGCMGWTTMYVVHFAVQPTSRKMANLPYCVWIMALTTLQLAVHLVEQLLNAFYQTLQCEPSNFISSTNNSTQYPVMESFLLWKAINENGLAYFLLANVLTGFVNIVMETDHASFYLSLSVLSTYILVLLSVILTLSRFSVHLKFW